MLIVWSDHSQAGCPCTVSVRMVTDLPVL